MLVFLNKALKSTFDKLLKVSGFIISNPTPRRNILKFLSGLLLLIFNVMIWYTCLAHSSDSLFVLKTAMFYGIGCQSIVRYYVNLTNTYVLKELVEKTDDMYVVTRKNKNGTKQKVMNDCIVQAARVFKLAFILYLISGSIFFVSPIYDYFISEKKTLVFPFKVPFIDIESPLGFGVTFTIQVIINLFMVVCLSAVDGAFIVYGMQIYGIVELLKIEFEILAVELEFSAYTNVPKNFRKMIIGHKKLDAFIIDFNEFYGLTSCAVVASSVMSICIGIIAIVFVGWYAAIGFLLAVFYQLFITCAVGTFIQVQVKNVKRLSTENHKILFKNSCIEWKVSQRSDLELSLVFVESSRTQKLSIHARESSKSSKIEVFFDWKYKYGNILAGMGVF